MGRFNRGVGQGPRVYVHTGVLNVSTLVHTLLVFPVQILDDGRVTDSQGRTIRCVHVVMCGGAPRGRAELAVEGGAVILRPDLTRGRTWSLEVGWSCALGCEGGEGGVEVRR